MKSLKYLVSLALMLGSLPAYSQLSGGSEPVKVDAEFKTGVLENGLKYYIRPCTTSGEKAEFFIIHNVGSLQEEDNQQGLAHFLEHMAFNGTKNFPDKNFLNYFANIGVKFGANINAYTSKDRTVYNISAVPTERNSTIDSTILALHDWSSFISCEPKEIEAERGVVREEWRRSDDSRTRMMKAVWYHEQRGSKFADRDVLGKMDIIDNFTRDELLAYYHKWYRPDLQAVVVVGDIDVDYVEAKIKETFDRIPRAVNPAKREIYTIPVNEQINVGYFLDPSTKVSSVRMSVKVPFLSAARKQTKEQVQREVEYALLKELMKNRYSTLGRVKNPLVRSGIPTMMDNSYAMRTITVTMLPIDDRYEDATQALLEEYERIARYGFSDVEVSKAIVAFRTDWDRESTKELTNEDYVDMAVENFTRDIPLADVAARNAVVSEAIESITVDDVNAFVKEIMTDSNRTIVYCGNTSKEEMFPKEDKIEAMAAAVKESEMERFVMEKTKAPTFKSVVAPASIVSQSRDENLDADVLVLSNGLKIVWKHSPANAEPMRLSLISRVGAAAFDEAGVIKFKCLDTFAPFVSISNLSRAEKDMWLQEQSMRVFMGFERNCSKLVFASRGTAESSEIFKVVNAFVSDMNINDKDFILQRKLFTKALERGRSSAGAYSDTLDYVVYDDALLLRGVTADEMEGISKEDMMSAYNRAFSNLSNCELVVTSKTPLSDHLAAIESSFEGATATKADAKRVQPASQIRKGEVKFDYVAKNQTSSKSSVEWYLHTKCKFSAKEDAQLRFFISLFQDHLMRVIREQMGATYVVGVTGALMFSENPYQYIRVAYDTNPELLDVLFPAMHKVLKDLATNGPTEQEVENIKLYMLKIAKDEKVVDLKFHTRAVDMAVYGVDLMEGNVEALEAVSAKMMKKLAAKYYKSGNSVEVTFRPE